MPRPAFSASKIIPTACRLALLSVMLFSPIVAVSYAGDQGLRIEAPAQKKTGAGFVLLVSLQRR